MRLPLLRSHHGHPFRPLCLYRRVHLKTGSEECGARGEPDKQATSPTTTQSLFANPPGASASRAHSPLLRGAEGSEAGASGAGPMAKFALICCEDAEKWSGHEKIWTTVMGRPGDQW